MSEVYIQSTLTNDQEYIVYKKPNAAEVNQTINHIATQVGRDGKEHEIILHVKGGANRANRAFITVDGAVTETNKELVEIVEKNCELFRIHKAQGFIKVTDYHQKKVGDLEKKDKSAQLTQDDFKKKGRKAPKTKKEAEATGGDDD